MKKVRFRTLGCYPLTGATESDAADTMPTIIEEMLVAPGRANVEGRVIDHDEAGRDGGEEDREGTSDVAPERTQIDEQDIAGYLKQHGTRSCLRLLTCGSVDDGKSHADRAAAVRLARSMFEDQLAAARTADSKKFGTTARSVDPAALDRRAAGRARAGHHH